MRQQDQSEDKVFYEIKDKNIIIRKKEVEQSMLNEKKLQDISGLVMNMMIGLSHRIV